MLDGGINQLARYFVIGVVGLLLTTLFNLFQNRIEETGDRYYRIPVLGNEFRGKQARQAAVISIPLFGFVIMAILQPQLIQLAIDDMRVLSTLSGLLIVAILISSSAEPDNWKIYDGRRSTQSASVIGVLMIIGPWVGPWLINIISSFLLRQYNRFTAFLVNQFNNLTSFVFEWFATHSFTIIGVLLLFTLLGYVVQKINTD